MSKEVLKEKSQEQAMSEFCRIAHKLYDIWQAKGVKALREFLVTELEIPEHDAFRFSRNYNPKKPPAKVCPIYAYRENWSSSLIFSELSIQLDGAVWPKNILAWWIMRHIFGSDVFDFYIPADSEHENGKNIIKFPALPADINGDAASFGLAALEAEGVQDFPAHVVRKAKKLYSELGEVGYELAKTFIDARFIFPPSKEVEQIAQIVKRGLDGEKVILTGVFCPDYAYEETGDLQCPYRYTFEGVSGGVGLVAQQFVRVLPYLVNFFRRNNIEFEVILSIADFEANSVDILKRVGREKTDFVDFCRKSLENFERAVPSVDMKLLLFEEEWSNGRLNRYIQEAFEQMENNDFGQIKNNTGKNPMLTTVNFIARSNRKFYEDWHGKELSGQEIENLVLLQGAEYAAVGRIFREDFGGQPFIQIAADRPKMQIFNSMYSSHPTLCTKRVY